MNTDHKALALADACFVTAEKHLSRQSFHAADVAAALRGVGVEATANEVHEAMAADPRFVSRRAGWWRLATVEDADPSRGSKGGRS